MGDDTLGAEMAKPGEKGVSTRISEEKYAELEEALSFYGISRSKFVKFCIDAVIELYRKRQKLSVPIEFTPGTGLPGEESSNQPPRPSEKS